MSVFSYRISAVDVSGFKCADKFDANSQVDVKTGYSFKINEVENLIACFSSYSYMQNNVVLLSLDLICVFKIKKESFEALRKGNEYIVPVEYLQYMATICVGTARGEIHARAEQCNSGLKEIVLPPINLTEIITSDAIFSVDA